MSLQLALQEKLAINRVVNLSNNILRTHGEGGIDKEVMSRNNCNRATLNSQGLPTLYHPDANNVAQSAVEILTTSNTGGCNNVGDGIVDFNIRVLLQKPVADLKAIARDEHICLKGIKKKKDMATKIHETRLAKTQLEEEHVTVDSGGMVPQKRILTTSNTGGCNNVGDGIVDFNIRVLLQKPVADLKAIARDEHICLKGIKKKKDMATKIHETRLAKTQPEEEYVTVDSGGMVPQKRRRL
jgi:hypothetical protein